MLPKIINLPQKKLIGMRVKMTFADNKTGILWRSFMPRRKEIKNNLSSDLVSMKVYTKEFNFSVFNPNHEFEKWAAIEVDNFDTVPEKMEKFMLEGGLYAVFMHKGSNYDLSTFEYIFEKWLPNSKYLIDMRPHFEILGEKYKNEDQNSEEEIWIPIKSKEKSNY